MRSVRMERAVKVALGTSAGAELGRAAFQVAHPRSGDRTEGVGSHSNRAYLSAASMNGARIHRGLGPGTGGDGRIGASHGGELVAHAGNRHGHAAVTSTFASADASVEVDARCRAERARQIWTKLVAVFRGTLESRFLVHLAGCAEHDERWPGMPMAAVSHSVVEEPADSSIAQRAAARVGEAEQRRGSRRVGERQVERALCPTWVTSAMMRRTARLLEHSEEPEVPGVDMAQVARLLAVVGSLPPAWAVLAGRIYLIIWTTSHRLHDREHGRRYLGRDASDSLSHSLHCMPLRLTAGLFDETSAPDDCAVEFFGGSDPPGCH